MKKLLIVLLALVMVLGVVACGDKKTSTVNDNKDDDKKTESKTAKDEDSEKEAATTEELANPEFEFTFESLTLKVSSVEDYEYVAENVDFDAPEGKYVIVACNVLSGELSTGKLSGIYNCLKLNGAEPVKVTTSGIMNISGGQMSVGTETIINLIFDVPADFDNAKPYFTAD
ncbi:MAG: hypothetical protein J5585_02020 [Clostridia bacterium]|nr:hypothetical protein [Clostridia bacterium]